MWNINAYNKKKNREFLLLPLAAIKIHFLIISEYHTYVVLLCIVYYIPQKYQQCKNDKTNKNFLVYDQIDFESEFGYIYKHLIDMEVKTYTENVYTIT